MSTRSNTVIVSLIAALVIPRIQKLTGMTLTLDDVATLIGVGAAAVHAGAAVFERYFPPPQAKVLAEAPSTPVVTGKGC